MCFSVVATTIMGCGANTNETTNGGSASSTGFLDKLYDANKDLAYSDDGNIYAFPFSGQEYVLWYY